MKNFLIITALTHPFGIFAQGPNTNINPPPQSQNVNYINLIDENNNSLGNTSYIINDDINPIQTNLGNQQANPPAEVQQQATQGSFFGSENNNEKPCNDCDEVKTAIKASHYFSSGVHHSKSVNMKQWSKKVSGKMHMKMRKTFSRSRKVKTNYAICFNWH